MSKDTLRALVVCMLFAVYVLSGGLSVPSQDFNAVWMAGKSFSAGQFDQIYPVTDGVFALQSPPEWNAQLAADGAVGPIYPFIYPPLWAWAAQALPATTTLQTAVAIVFVLNTAALIAMAWLAWRMTGRNIPLSLYLAVACFIFAFTNAGRIALGNNQPQIILSLILVASLNRMMAGRAVSAGGLMALAASLKGVPVLYALLWGAQGKWRPLAVFAITGACLAALSISVAGWPLHDAFLGLLRDIRGTFLVLPYNLSLDAVIGDVFFSSPSMIQDQAYVGQDPIALRIATAKPDSAILISSVLLLVMLMVSALLLRRNPNDPLVWPLILILISFVSPLAWSYHYLTSMAFLPALLGRLGHKAGGLWIAVLTIPTFPIFYTTAIQTDAWTTPYHVLTTALIPLMALAFALAIRRGPPPS